jgi:putative PIN family toxin of toxin-antitoxin system
MRPRFVLDTNAWLDWLVFDDPAMARLKAAVAAGRAEIVIDAACEAELERVLAYPLGRFALDEPVQAACLAECRRVALRVERAAPPANLPRCRDPDDQKFLEAAAAAGAHVLVTRDLALLELARRALPFRILAPEKMGSDPVFS